MRPQVKVPKKNGCTLQGAVARFRTNKWLFSVISIAASVGAYALLLPLELAVGLVTMLFIHEAGHLWAAKQKGLPVTAPLFIPFIGAYIFMKSYPRDARTEAYIALAGPVVGTAGALIVFFAGMWLQNSMLLIIAQVGFFLNLINLLPLHPMDGGRITAAVTRWLWLAGFVGGLLLVIWLRSPLFFVIWALFSWEMYNKTLRANRTNIVSAMSKIKLSLDELTLRGVIIPGSDHHVDLPFVTYSTLDRSQKIRVRWDALSMHEVIRMPDRIQGLIQRVTVIGVEQVPPENPDTLYVYCQIDYVPHFENAPRQKKLNVANDQGYYTLPAAARWKYGAAYAGLSAFLIWMLYAVYQQGIVTWF